MQSNELPSSGVLDAAILSHLHDAGANAEAGKSGGSPRVAIIDPCLVYRSRKLKVVYTFHVPGIAILVS